MKPTGTEKHWFKHRKFTQTQNQWHWKRDTLHFHLFILRTISLHPKKFFYINFLNQVWNRFARRISRCWFLELKSWPMIGQHSPGILTWTFYTSLYITFFSQTNLSNSWLQNIFYLQYKNISENNWAHWKALLYSPNELIWEIASFPLYLHSYMTTI